MNYERIDIILSVLNGNGKVGICEQVRGHSRALRFLWTLFVLVSSALAGALFTLLRL